MASLLELETRAASPVTLSDVKPWLRIEHNDEDTVLLALIDACTQAAEDYVARDLRANTWRYYLDLFSEGLLVPREVETIDEVARLVSGTYTAIDPATYFLERSVWDAIVWLAEDQEWPTDGDSRPQCVRIEFTARVVEPLPPITQAILRHIAYLFENRGDCGVVVGAGITNTLIALDTMKLAGVTTLLDPYRVARF